MWVVVGESGVGVGVVGVCVWGEGGGGGVLVTALQPTIRDRIDILHNHCPE